MIQKDSDGICGNCGADKGLHKFDSFQCPKNGMEELREGKKQQWENTVFDNTEWKRISEAGPYLYDALVDIYNELKNHPSPAAKEHYTPFIEKMEKILNNFSLNKNKKQLS